MSRQVLKTFKSEIQSGKKRRLDVGSVLVSRICLASLWLTCTVRDNLRKVLNGIVVRLYFYFYFWGSTVLILEIPKISSRTANTATLFKNTIICHLDAMQIKQQCLGRMQH